MKSNNRLERLKSLAQAQQDAIRNADYELASRIVQSREDLVEELKDSWLRSEDTALLQEIRAIDSVTEELIRHSLSLLGEEAEANRRGKEAVSSYSSLPREIKFMDRKK